MCDGKLRIIVTGMVAQYPVGGVAWDYLQYVVGLARLGHDVYYHEDSWCWPYDPIQKTASADGQYSATFLCDFFRRYAPELSERWHYDHLHEASYGMSRQAFDEVAKTADLFINNSGASAIPDALRADCVKVFLDSDPGYNQIMLIEKFDWSENVERWCNQVADHDRHFTYGENIGKPDCLVPAAGYDWRPTRMPIVLDLWEALASDTPPLSAPWTTVMTWNNFKGNLVHRDVEYKGKGSEFEKIVDLPSRVASTLRVAVGGKNVPRSRLVESGWDVVDGPETTLTPASYQSFIRNSRGEVSTAKHVYVAMRTGWFSCRSACYLAAGRPAALQDTGFSRFVPCGEGVLAFENLEQAVESMKEVEADYLRHSAAAREIAREIFDATRILRDLIEQAMV